MFTVPDWPSTATGTKLENGSWRWMMSKASSCSIRVMRGRSQTDTETLPMEPRLGIGTGLPIGMNLSVFDLLWPGCRSNYSDGMSPAIELGGKLANMAVDPPLGRPIVRGNDSDFESPFGNRAAGLMWCVAHDGRAPQRSCSLGWAVIGPHPPPSPKGWLATRPSTSGPDSSIPTMKSSTICLASSSVC